MNGLFALFALVASVAAPVESVATEAGDLAGNAIGIAIRSAPAESIATEAGASSETSAIASTFRAIAEIPGNLIDLTARAGYETARSFGLVRGSWKDRRALRPVLDAFVEGSDRSFQGEIKSAARFQEPLYQKVVKILESVRSAEVGDHDRVRQSLRAARTGATKLEAALVAEAEVVLLGSQAEWKRVSPLCAAPDDEREPGLFADDEVTYRCSLAAAAAGDWRSAESMAARLGDGSDYQAYAWYAAASAARDAKELETATKALERVAGHTADWNRKVMTDPERRQVAVLEGWSPACLLEQRALAALVLLHAEAGDTVEANRALLRMSPDGPWYAHALAGLPEIHWDELRDRLRKADTTESMLAVSYGRSLLDVGRPDLASDVAATARPAIEALSASARTGERLLASWIAVVVKAERTRLEAERARRMAIADRVWPVIGSFGTKPSGPRRSWSPVRSIDGSSDFFEPILARYLSDEPARRVVRLCLNNEKSPSGCSSQLVAAYEHVRDGWKEELRTARYELERLSADAYFERTSSLNRPVSPSEGTTP